jgi:hypothetical protein
MTSTRRVSGTIVAAAAGIAAASVFGSAARAAFIVDQEPTAGIGLQSTFYTLQPGASFAEIDTFTTTAAYRLGTLTAFSSSDGGGAPLSASASIYEGAPPDEPGSTLVATASGNLDASHSIVVDFGNELLPAGSYFLTAFVVRQTELDGIWYWNTTYSGPQALTWAIGEGQPPAPETNPNQTGPLALAYTLTGTLATPAPELPTWALFDSGFALAGLLSTRRRLRCITSRS